MIRHLQLMIQRIRLFSPITKNFLLLIAAILIGMFVYKKYANTQSDFQPIVLMMCKIALILILLIVVFALVSVLISFWFFKTKFIHLQNQLQINFAQVAKNKNKEMHIRMQLQKVIIPFMGFIKTSFLHDGNQYTPILQLSSSAKQNGWFVKQLIGDVQLQVNDVREYHIQKGFLYFQDLFCLFSFPFSFAVNQIFENYPKQLQELENNNYPKQSKEMTIRIPELRRVDGELLQYKKFNTSDDTRRIIWKIFAKNRELVVRTAEIFNPFTSHLTMYASYQFGIGLLPNSLLTNQLLNYYKDAVYTVYDVLQANEYAVQYFSDQSAMTETSALQQITNSTWQKNVPPQDLIKPKLAAVICLSSLNNIKDIELLLQDLQLHTSIYLVRTSVIFKQNLLLKTLQRIFVLPPKDQMETLRNQWWMSGAKTIVEKNEKQIIALLQKQNFNFTIL
jgi:hypothetical protein